MTTYYDTLDVAEDATQESIESAFERLAKETHPDQNNDPNAAQQFIRIKEAYDILSEPAERARYDELGHDSYMQQVSGDGQTSSRSDSTGSSSRHTTSETGKTDWQSHTRGSAEAEYIWNGATERVAGTQPEGKTNVVRRVLGYATVAIPIPIMTVIAILQVLTSQEQGRAVLAGIPSWLVLLLVVACSALCVVVAEILLDTDRRLISSLG